MPTLPLFRLCMFNNHVNPKLLAQCATRNVHLWALRVPPIPGPLRLLDLLPMLCMTLPVVSGAMVATVPLLCQLMPMFSMKLPSVSSAMVAIGVLSCMPIPRFFMPVLLDPQFAAMCVVCMHLLPYMLPLLIALARLYLLLSR